MGEVEIDKATKQLIIRANIFLYGNAASAELAEAVAADIQAHWNEPRASVKIDQVWYDVIFQVTGIYDPGLMPVQVYENTDPQNNYFRVEEYVQGNISFVDAINCNSGYFKLDNLLNNSTTAAHEFGHTLGLEHPEQLDIRGKGVPGIMYPRGTITDPIYQYDPEALPLAQGGTMNPFNRKVSLNDIADLRLWELAFNDNNKSMIGAFTAVWHEADNL